MTDGKVTNFPKKPARAKRAAIDNTVGTITIDVQAKLPWRIGLEVVLLILEHDMTE
jgi:hypothetical protein